MRRAVVQVSEAGTRLSAAPTHSCRARSPHILAVYDAGEYESRQYLVTEFVDGGTLQEWASKEKPSWRQVVDLLTGVADGLAAAHIASILHRDAIRRGQCKATSGIYGR